MRPKGSAATLEYRRRQAVQLFKAGKKVSDVARWLGTAKSSVSRWLSTYKKKGLRGLKPKPVPGRPCKLRRHQKPQLLRLLLRGASAAGYSTDLWTTQRIAEIIWKHFSIRYDRDHIGPLLRSLGWSWQKPERRASERDEEYIENWKRHKWPHIKKSPNTWRPSRFPR